MGVTTGTYLKYDAKGLREQLTDDIFRISPEDTPFLSSIGRMAATQTLVEWQTDALRTAVTTNQVLEGNEADYSTPSATVRVGNYTQIATDTLSVSGTLEEINKAGRKSEIKLQLAKKGASIKQDMEMNALHNVGGNAGAAGTARKMATMGAWLKTNTNFYTTDGGDPVYTAGVPAAARTDGGTLRGFTETIAKDVISQMWTAGGKPRVLMTGPFNKSVVSGMAGIATRNFDISNASPKPTAIIASADVYVSDFGPLRVIPCRNQRERDAWFLDWDMLSLATLRPFEVKKMGPNGDAEKFLLVTEYTLQVKQEAGLGAAYDLTTA